MSHKMNHPLIFFSFLLTLQVANAQSKIPTPDSLTAASQYGSIVNLIFLTDCEKAGSIAENDIKENRIFLLIVGGIASRVYTTDTLFEEKYSAKYHDFGCTSPQESCLLKYNWVVFDYLTKKFGKSWTRKVRNDVVGIGTWKKLKT